MPTSHEPSPEAEIYARAAVAWYGWGSPIAIAVILVAIAAAFYIVRAALLL